MKTFKELQERLAEAKVEAGRSDYGKASVRNKRKFGREGKPAVFDLPFSGGHSDRGKMIDQRRAEHKAKRGVKTKAVKEGVRIADANGNDFLEVVDPIKPEPMKSPKNNVQWTEEKIARIMDSAKEKKRKNALQINKIVGTQ